MRRNDLPAVKNELLVKLEQEGVPVVEMSTITQEGIMAVRDRVSITFFNKLKRKKTVKRRHLGLR